MIKYKDGCKTYLKSFIISFQTIIKGSQYHMYADLTFLKALILEIVYINWVLLAIRNFGNNFFFFRNTGLL